MSSPGHKTGSVTPTTHTSSDRPAAGRPALVEFEYKRGGTLAYLAAWDVHHARIFGRCEPKTGIEPFGRLVEQVMSTEPYASAKTVFWVVDNGSSHTGKTSIARMQDAYANARLIHLPVHVSWLNQIEIYFSILQRKALTPNDFANLDALAARITAFEARHGTPARTVGAFSGDPMRRSCPGDVGAVCSAPWTAAERQ